MIKKMNKNLAFSSIVIFTIGNKIIYIVYIECIYVYQN